MGTLLNSPQTDGATELGLGLFDSICDPKTPYKPDIVTFNTLLRHHVARGDWDAMLGLVSKITGHGLQADVVTYTTLVEGMLKCGKRDTARATLDIMQDQGIKPSVRTYGLLIGDLARNAETEKDVQRAEALIARMQADGLSPNTATFTALLGGYFRANMVDAGIKALKTMERAGYDMDCVTYNMILRSIVNSEIQPDKIDQALASSTENSKDAYRCSYRSILDAMTQRGYPPDRDTWSIILTGLHRASRFDEADQVMLEMKNRNSTPWPGSALDKLMRDLQLRRRFRERVMSRY